MLARRGDERFAHLGHVAAVRYSNRNAKTHSPVAISPVGHGRIDEFLVRHDHGDVVVSDNYSAACADLPHLTGNACDFDPITDGDGTFGQNEQAADEIAGDVFQTKSHAYAHGAGEHGQRSNMDAGILQNDDDPDDQHRVADYLGNCMLQSAVETASGQDTIKKETFGAG